MTDKPTLVKEGTATILTVSLAEHQRVALEWMLRREQGHRKKRTRQGAHHRMTMPRPAYCTLEQRHQDSRVGGVLADDMGLGKTLTVIALLIQSPYAGRVLVVVPRVLLSQWAEEIASRTTLCSERVVIYHGSARRKRFLEVFGDAPDPTPHSSEEGLRVCLTTYGVVRREHESSAGLLHDNHRPWTRVVLDEAHVIRGKKSGTHRAALALPDMGRRWAVTGTPISNSIDDMAALAAFVGVQPYCTQQWWDAANPEAIDAWKKEYFMRRTKDALDLNLPPKHTRWVDLHLSASEHAEYETLMSKDAAAKAVSEYERYEAMTWSLRARQACVHPLLNTVTQVRRSRQGRKRKRETTLHTRTKPDDNEIDYGTENIDYDGQDIDTGDAWSCSAATPAVGHGSKFDAAIEYCLSTSTKQGHKTIIFSQWVGTLQLMSEALCGVGIGCVIYDGDTPDKDAVLQRFKTQQDTAVLLCSLQCAAVGLNLVCANHVIMMDQCYNPAIEDQAVDRVYRMGQTREVTVLRFRIAGSVEMQVSRVTAEKRNVASRFLRGTGPIPVQKVQQPAVPSGLRFLLPLSDGKNKKCRCGMASRLRAPEFMLVSEDAQQNVALATVEIKKIPTKHQGPATDNHIRHVAFCCAQPCKTVELGHGSAGEQPAGRKAFRRKALVKPCAVSLPPFPLLLSVGAHPAITRV